MRLKISITRDILEKSMYCPLIKSCSDIEFEMIKTNCAFSIVWREIFPDALVWQTNAALTPNDDDSGFIFHPVEVTDYIKLFDNCETFEDRLKIPERSFEFEIPDSVIDKIGLKELESILDKSETLEKV